MWQIDGEPEIEAGPAPGDWARRWTIRRDGDVRRVTVWMSGSLVEAPTDLAGTPGADDALRTAGQSAVELILDMDDPPDRIEFHPWSHDLHLVHHGEPVLEPKISP